MPRTHTLQHGKEGKHLSPYFHAREYKGKMSDIIFRRILRLLQGGDFDIVVTTKTGGEAGYIDYENNLIYLNPKLFPVEETLIHETLHILKPELDEQSIIEMSSLMFEHLDEKRRDTLIAFIQALAVGYRGVKSNDLKASY